MSLMASRVLYITERKFEHGLLDGVSPDFKLRRGVINSNLGQDTLYPG
jgi:hypothetical protein